MTDDIDDAWSDAAGGQRHETDPSDDGTPSLADAIADRLAELADDANPTIGVRDERLLALLQGAEDADELNTIAADLADELDREADDPSRSDVVRLAVRVGLQTAAPDTLEAAERAYDQYLREQREF